MTTIIYRTLIDHWVAFHGLIAISGLAIYATSSHALHLRRHPSAAISWVAALVLLPYAALPLYLIFGIRKVASLRPATGRILLPGAASGPDSLPGRTRQLAAVMALPAASTYQHLRIHADGSEALQALLGTIDAAAHSIELCTFIFARDSLGAGIALAMERRAREGIRVRLMVDGLGAYLGGHPDFKKLSAAGIQIALFVPPLRSSLRGRTNLRNHRKMVIADGDRLWCGGRNLAAEYFSTDPASEGQRRSWTDLSFDLHGALAQQAQQQFEQDWEFATRAALPEPRATISPAVYPGQAASDSGQAEAQLIASGPDQMDDTLYTLLVSAFFSARKRIVAVTPYFVPNPTLLMSLTLAARRGVMVDLLMPARSNHRLADLARHRALRELAIAGARIWFLPQMIHAKAVVVDDEIALAGSANLDERSLFLNYELMVAFYDPADVRRFAGWIERQQGAAAPYLPKPPRLWQEIAEGMLLWLAFQL
jgi:cardiolipin synthase